MQTSIQYPTANRPTPTEHGSSRLRTVTGNRFPRKFSCGCGRILRVASIRRVVNLAAADRRSENRYPPSDLMSSALRATRADGGVQAEGKFTGL